MNDEMKHALSIQENPTTRTADKKRRKETMDKGKGKRRIRSQEELEELFFEWGCEAFENLMDKMEEEQIENSEISLGIHAFCHEVSSLAALHYGVE